MPTVIRSLKKLDVIVRVVADFDVLNDTNPLRQIYEELGGTWTDIEGDWKFVKHSIDEMRSDLETDDVKKEIMNILEKCGKNVPKDKVSDIEKILKKTSAWSKAKDVGRSFITGGDPIRAYDGIQEKLKKKGLFIVEVGQLEGFCRSIGNHGPKWVNEVMAKNLKDDTELETARRFIQDVIS
jgi:hypothetical protein